MAPSFYVEETISSPPAAVWTGLTDWGNAHKWMRGIESMSVDGPTAQGTRLTFHTRGAERHSSIAACDPERLIVLRSVQGGVTADYTYQLHPLGDAATKVTLLAECRFTGFWWRVLAPLIRFAIRMTDGGQLKALKSVLKKK